ncbi:MULTISPECIES: nickel pincer cofactor biosynthesis protein LarC [unclassified Lentimonas]|uniref:nickel pincer cofactor biosynthesis protein LarC n=1 Tax=unclassified Lentimonas TaxID=2630993 RepID=UPI00132B6238|nr:MULTISPECIES: nickel pincer cofactor biosynthesis protein LarC [unclassified Lentimonas]CAA6679569.1 FIG099352: hypothetical protein [Lentimonas sp. CC4]CAA6687287.1 FIG099352: hypothetical protein [Lentimonas sp. CC6]CAA7077182.1 FIG099352: hypothetical protein [Lentimonas sp. CC4]CAA7171799.1 FIG099352: hypothetical protein [Lentimonas sp. CC21]CAA7183444.1 FIG099352: hypothetical protein [Lentimonas sp. CC8]
MSTLLYQCPAGLSGDMNLAAMVGLGVCPDYLRAELAKLPYDGWALSFEQDMRAGISGLRCDVLLTPQFETSLAAHPHVHTPGHQAHTHRTFAEIRSAIEASTLNDRVKRDALACFTVLAEAEGAVHGVSADEVHFHEVGAIDSIVDIVGAAICWDYLNVERIVCSTLEVGGGTVKCAHGRMPVPAPATSQLLQGVALTAGASDFECTTPTGAALLVGRGCEFAAAAHGTQVQVARGIGQRKDPRLSNVVYVTLLEEQVARNGSLQRDSVWEVVANIDDMTTESVAYLTQQLLDAGALDVWQVSATFKKNRVGVVVHALVHSAELDAVEAAFFKHSRSIGLRKREWERSKLPRELVEFESSLGRVRVKRATLPNGDVRDKLEHDDCAALAAQHGLSLLEVQQRLLTEWQKTL